MTGLADVLGSLYTQVRAPVWAARNLDALAEVLRDLSWLPDGAVELSLPDLSQLPSRDSIAVRQVLDDLMRETAAGRHPLHVLP